MNTVSPTGNEEALKVAHRHDDSLALAEELRKLMSRRTSTPCPHDGDVAYKERVSSTLAGFLVIFVASMLLLICWILFSVFVRDILLVFASSLTVTTFVIAYLWRDFMDSTIDRVFNLLKPRADKKSGTYLADLEVWASRMLAICQNTDSILPSLAKLLVYYSLWLKHDLPHSGQSGVACKQIIVGYTQKVSSNVKIFNDFVVLLTSAGVDVQPLRLLDHVKSCSVAPSQSYVEGD